MQKLYCVYDSKSESYDRPWPALNKGVALRSMLEVLKDPNHPFTKWPTDFTLFEIGEWDEQTGMLIPYAAKVSLGGLHEFSGLDSKDRSRSTQPVGSMALVQETQQGDIHAQ